MASTPHCIVISYRHSGIYVGFDLARLKMRLDQKVGGESHAALAAYCERGLLCFQYYVTYIMILLHARCMMQLFPDFPHPGFYPTLLCQLAMLHLPSTHCDFYFTF